MKVTLFPAGTSFLGCVYKAQEKSTIFIITSNSISDIRLYKLGIHELMCIIHTDNLKCTCFSMGHNPFHNHCHKCFEICSAGDLAMTTGVSGGPALEWIPPQVTDPSIWVPTGVPACPAQQYRQQRCLGHLPAQMHFTCCYQTVPRHSRVRWWAAQHYSKQQKRSSHEHWTLIYSQANKHRGLSINS